MKHKFILETHGDGTTLWYSTDDDRLFPVKFFTIEEEESLNFKEELKRVADEYLRRS